MVALIAEISDFEDQVLCDLPLDVEHVLFDVRRLIPLIIRLDLEGAEAGAGVPGAKRAGGFRGPRIVQQRRPIRAGDDVAVFATGVARHVEHGAPDILNIENAETRADTPVVSGTIRQTDARTEILVIRIHNVVATNATARLHLLGLRKAKIESPSPSPGSAAER